MMWLVRSPPASPFHVAGPGRPRRRSSGPTARLGVPHHPWVGLTADHQELLALPAELSYGTHAIGRSLAARADNPQTCGGLTVQSSRTQTPRRVTFVPLMSSPVSPPAVTRQRSGYWWDSTSDLSCAASSF